MNVDAKRWLLHGIDGAYRALNRHVLLQLSAQDAHDRLIRLLRLGERIPGSVAFATLLRKLTHTPRPTTVGGVSLSQNMILAAGMIKGDGFRDEDEAVRAVTVEQRNIMPGWRLVPALTGPVEFGSFTRYPRLGNRGTVIWRHTSSRSTQNRVGLRNPGARAAALFLAQRRDKLPAEFGINIALSPGVQVLEQQERELRESLGFFLDAGVQPKWLTLNLSCPNTEDDPHGNQLEAATRRLCSAFITSLHDRGHDIPLWVKVSPGLASAQYHSLMRIFHQVGVKAVVATNTLAKPSPDDAALTAGIGGGALYASALTAIEQLNAARIRHECAVDIVGCGGVLDGASLRACTERGAQAAQYWSAFVFRGPFAAAIIAAELARNQFHYEESGRESFA